MFFIAFASVADNYYQIQYTLFLWLRQHYVELKAGGTGLVSHSPAFQTVKEFIEKITGILRPARPQDEIARSISG
jgi:molybdopterin biosynthesis enzyme MoaB